LREVHRLRVFEKRVMRRMFVLKKDHVAGEWKKPHEELNELHCLMIRTA